MTLGSGNRDLLDKRLDARLEEPGAFPTRLPRPDLVASVRLAAHHEVRRARHPVVRRGGLLRDVTLAALMTGVTAIYFDWALTVVAGLYR